MPLPASPLPTSAKASAVMRANVRTDTRPEKRLRSELHRMGLRFRKDYPIRGLGGRPVRPDIVFTRAQVAVFVDGCFWHRCPIHGSVPRSNTDYWGPKLARNVERDHEVDARLEAAGWDIVRVWEHEDAPDAADQIAQLVRARRRHPAGASGCKVRRDAEARRD